MTSLTRNISRSNLTISLPLWKNPRWLTVRFQNVPIWPNRLSYYSKTSNIIPRSNLPIHKLRRNLKFWPITLWKKIHDGCRWNFKISLCGQSTMSKTSARVSSGFQTRENIWNHKAAGQVVLLFSSLWKPDETWSTSFWNDFFKETIQNDAVLYFSHFSVKCIVCVVCCIQSAFTIFVSFCF